VSTIFGLSGADSLDLDVKDPPKCIFVTARYLLQKLCVMFLYNITKQGLLKMGYQQSLYMYVFIHNVLIQKLFFYLIIAFLQSTQGT
jgi:hypothetical protein